jgi:cytidylate kinase
LRKLLLSLNLNNTKQISSFQPLSLKAITIAIDGHSSCGKSTLAKSMAKRLNYAYVDSGAMYRAVTLYFLRNQVDVKDEDTVRLALKDIKIHFENIDGKNATFLNNENVEEEIRSMEVSNFVSPVAAIPIVRKKVVKQQRALGGNKGIVMDGRDIGTVVFKKAELKIFLTADENIRAQRRHAELKQKGLDISLEEVLQNLKERDHIDSTREDSPLRKADDAIEINNSSMTELEQTELALRLAYDKIK